MLRTALTTYSPWICTSPLLFIGSVSVQYGTPSTAKAGMKFQSNETSGVVEVPGSSSTGSCPAAARSVLHANASSSTCCGTVSAGPGELGGANAVGGGTAC